MPLLFLQCEKSRRYADDLNELQDANLQGLERKIVGIVKENVLADSWDDQAVSGSSTDERPSSDEEDSGDDIDNNDRPVVIVADLLGRCWQCWW